MGLKRAVVAACIGAAFALPAAASAATRVVWAGGPVKFQNTLGNKYGAEANDFFPQRLTIAVGDKVTWQGMSIGFHSIDIPVRGGKDLPLIGPRAGTYSGVNDAAGHPFWFDFAYITQLGFNPLLFAPQGGVTYNGTARDSSGLPLSKKPYSVTFLKPGVYEYFCDVHYDMHGFIVVKAKGSKVPTQKQVTASVAAQVKRDTNVVKALEKSAAKLPTTKVSVGYAGKDNVEILAMLPGTITVSKGTTVHFSMSPLTGETHTVTFGTRAYLTPLINNFLGPAAIDPRALFPSSPPKSVIPVGPATHGNGFANSGALDEDPTTTTVPPGASFQFTVPGTYHFVCLIHPFMHGTVIVK